MKFAMAGKSVYTICAIALRSGCRFMDTHVFIVTSIPFPCSIILEADPSAVVKRVDLRNDDIPIGEQTVAQVTNTLNGLFW